MLKEKRVEEPKIVIALSFKEFLVDLEEDKKKIYCVKELQKQTYKNVIYVVTQFNEKNVESSLLPHIKDKSKWIFKRGKLINDNCKYSVTDMILNALDEAFKYENAMLLLFVTDNIWKRDFLAKIAQKYEKKVSGTVTRHRVYERIEDLGTKNYKYSNGIGSEGFLETLFFSSYIFKDENAYNDLARYRNEGWGGTEWLFMTFFELYADKLLNLFYYDSIYKLDESKPPGTIAMNMRTDSKNRAVLAAYRKYNGLNPDITNYIPLVLSFKDVPFIHKIRYLILSRKAFMYHSKEYGNVNTFLCVLKYLAGRKKAGER